MIHYVLGKWNLLFVLHLRGSVLPRAFLLAFPNALVAVGIWLILPYFRDDPRMDNHVSATQVWVGFNFVIGFMVSFRTNQAYTRWWEAAGLLQRARSQWFNAYSSAIAFVTTKPELKHDVDTYQQTLVRLMSLLHVAALHQISRMEHANFEVVDSSGLDKESMEYLKYSSERVEVLMQWIMRLTVLNHNAGVLPIAPPIMARFFQELALGFVSYTNARRITEFMFPFACAQLVSMMILIHWFITPFVCALILDSWHWVGIVSFIAVFSITSVNDMANSIELPFGDNPNDLPLQELSRYMNKILLTIIDKMAQTPPVLDPKHMICKASGEPRFFRKPRVKNMTTVWRSRPSRLSDFLFEDARAPLVPGIGWRDPAKYFADPSDDEGDSSDEERAPRFVPESKYTSRVWSPRRRES